MNVEKTGKFLQELRKEKGMTQKELAEEIKVSDKTISKWENGNGLPDIISLNALSTFFQVSMNELLAGERVSGEEYQKKAEETIIGLLEDEQKNRKAPKVFMLLGMVLLLSGILYALISSQGISFLSVLPMWFDAGALFSLLLIYFALAMILWVREKEHLWDKLSKVVIPIGVLMSLMHLIDIFLTGTWDKGMFVQAAYSLTPMLYAAGAYILIILMIKSGKQGIH